MPNFVLVTLRRKVFNSPWAIFVAALLVRLVVLSEIVPHLRTSGYFDHNETTRVAWAVVSGYGFSSPWPDTSLIPTAVLPPLYPMLVAVIFKLLGPFSDLSVWTATVLNGLFSAATAVLIIRVGTRMFGSAVAIIAAWIWAMSPYEAIVAARIWESSLSAFLLMSILWLASSAGDLRSYRYWILFGVLGGASGLNSPALLPVFALVLLWLWLASGRHFHGAQIATCLLICLLTLFPWMLRNYLTFHRIIPVRDNFGFELWRGNNDGSPREPGEFQRLGEIRFMETRRDQAFAFIAQHPQEFALRCAQRFFRFWTNPDVLVWLPVSTLAWIGAGIILFRRRIEAIPLVIVLVFFPLVYYITHPGITYRNPIEPIIVLLGTDAVISLFAQVKVGILNRR